MKIKEYNQMKAELIKDDRGDSTGAFINFVREQRALDQEPRTMAHGGRIGYDEGSSYEYKIKEIMGKHPGMTRPLAIRIIEAGISPDDYDAIAGLENKADGGRIGFKDAKRVVNYPKNRAKKTVLPALDRVSKQLLDAFAKDDILYITENKSKIGNFSKDDYQLLKRIQNNADDLAYVAGKTKWADLDANDILNLIEDREAYLDLEKSSISQKAAKETQFGPKRKFYKQAENWIVKNSSRYADPDKFKKAFLRTFGKDNHLIESINAGKATGFNVDFSDWFKESILGTSYIKRQPGTTYNSKLLDDIFKTSIYTNNKNVQKRILNEFNRILPPPGSKRIPDIRYAFIDSPLLQKFGINESIRGPIARLLADNLTKGMMKQISMFRDPFLGTGDLITFLKDRVDPKYKSMFEEAAKAVRHAQTKQWPAAKKALNLSQNIMFDHSIPKELISLGYADEIEYIKLNPTSAEFNQTIKRTQFDQPMIRLSKELNKAKTIDAKTKIFEEMKRIKNKFSKKYGNYLDNVKINMDKKGKLTFTSDAPVVTKKTDLVKSLKTSLQQEEFPKMSKTKQAKFLNTFSKTFQDLSPQSVLQMARTHKCGGLNEGGSIMSCLQKKFKADPEKFLQRSASLAKGNPNLRKWFMRGKNIARGTGVFAAWEAVFAPVLMGWMATEGESWDRMKHDLSWGPVLEALGVSPKFVPGKSESEVWMEAAGGDEGAHTMKKLEELQDQELPYLYQQLEEARRANAPTREKVIQSGRPSYTGYHETLILKDIKEKELELQDIWNKSGFMEGPAGGKSDIKYLNMPVIRKASTIKDAADAKVIADKKANLEEYIEKGYVADPDWYKQEGRISRMGGGMVGIRKPSALPPTGGPMHQGLRSLYNNVKKS